MDKRQRAMFGKLDSAFENERSIALEQLIKSGFLFRREFETLENEVAEGRKTINAFRFAKAAAIAQNKALRGMVWSQSFLGRRSRRTKLALAGGVLAVVIGYW